MQRSDMLDELSFASPVEDRQRALSRWDNEGGAMRAAEPVGDFPASISSPPGTTHHPLTIQVRREHRTRTAVRGITRLVSD